jgi:UDP-N-acetylglucosamine 2-epimerase
VSYLLKTLTILGTRPELIKMSRVIAELDRHTRHVLVHTGQNYDYELNQIFFDELEIRKPDHFLGAGGENAAHTIGQVIIKSDEILALEQPDAVLLYGDTNSCMAVIAAKRRKIPVFHMEAGNRCFDQRVPEELNRKVLDHLSDINLVLTEHARRYLIAEGIRPETIIKTGSHMDEVLKHYMPSIEKSDVIQRLGFKKGEFFVVSAHREENVDTPQNLRDLVTTLNALANAYGFPIIVSTHPRTRKRLDALGVTDIHNLVDFTKPMGFFDFVKLQMEAKCVISDSGTITEESTLLNVPAITIRYSHERPEGMDEGALVMCGLKKEEVLDAVKVICEQYAEHGPMRQVADYLAPAVSRKIVRLVMSYTGYINRTVWRHCV